MLISRDKFVGLEEVTHLCAGGESPMLKSHEQAFNRFMRDKSMGERTREKQDAVLKTTREQCAQLLSVEVDDVTLLGSASEGINAVMYGLSWQAGDNVVIADVEFASGVYPWTRLADQGVEIRIARHRDWCVDLESIDSLIDERTRVVLISHVSMFTGQRMDLAALSALVRQRGARLVLDATHAVGVVDVDASLADVVVSSCYKWLLGVHGCAIFYCNRERFPELEPPFLGWNSVSAAGGWRAPLEMTLRSDADRFIPGNPSYVSIYLLNNALDALLATGIHSIEEHALKLTGALHHGLTDQGWEVMTPAPAEFRAGNVCLMTDRVDEIAQTLREHQVMVWGTYAGDARLRISAHVYNDQDDVEKCLQALSSIR